MIKDKVKNMFSSFETKRVLKTFVYANIASVVAAVAVSLLYFILSLMVGRSAGEITEIVEKTGFFSAVGIFAILVMLYAVYRTVKRVLFKNGVSVANCVALELLIIVVGILAYLMSSNFNVFSYIALLLIPTIVAYYVSKRKFSQRD